MLPVFYNVKPSEVRKQTGPFAIDIAHGTSVNDERIQKWRDALRQVANIAGWDMDLRYIISYFALTCEKVTYMLDS